MLDRSLRISFTLLVCLTRFATAADTTDTSHSIDTTTSVPTGTRTFYSTDAGTSTIMAPSSTGPSGSDTTMSPTNRISSTRSMTSAITTSFIDTTALRSTEAISTGSSPSDGTTVVASTATTVKPSTEPFTNAASSTMMTTSVTSTYSIQTSSPTIATNVSLIYKYIVESASPLALATSLDITALASVQQMVTSSFNLPNFLIRISRLEIKRKQRIAVQTQSDMIATLLFTSTRTDCDVNCIKNAATANAPTMMFQLPSTNGTLVDVIAKSAPIEINNEPMPATPAPVERQKGESPPGMAARLGMGLGITIIAVILIVEIIFLYRKYGCSPSSRESAYALSSLPNRYRSA